MMQNLDHTLVVTLGATRDILLLKTLYSHLVNFYYTTFSTATQITSVVCFENYQQKKTLDYFYIQKTYVDDYIIVHASIIPFISACCKGNVYTRIKTMCALV